jgi:DNA topoisomerase-3
VLEGEREDEASLPPLRPGASEASDVPVSATATELLAEQTKPAARITEARLLSLMENAGEQVEDEDHAAAMHERGLGTPATRAEVIENLIAKGYVVRIGRVLRPTAKGIRLIDILRRVHIDRLASARLTGEIEFHLNQVEHGQRSGDDFMDEMKDYAREIVAHGKSFQYEDLYASDPPLGRCPRCERPVVEGPWFYRCQEQPPRDEDCPFRIWKDTSGRYLDRGTAETLLRDGRTGSLEGFTARNGRTYQAALEIDRDEWVVRVRPVAWEDGTVREDPEYDVNPEPLGACPFEEECQVVETPTHFSCERKLKEAELGNGNGSAAAGNGEAPERPKSCGFALPRTVCKREITREEALVYLAKGRSELLTDFTSRYGRPFSATLVLKKTGRHGFEFPPRAEKRAAAEGNGAAAADATGAAEVGDAAGSRGFKRGRRRAPEKTAEKPLAKPARAAKSRSLSTKRAPSTKAKRSRSRRRAGAPSDATE